MKIILTSVQKHLVQKAKKRNNPKLLYGLFTNIVSNQYYALRKLTDEQAMNYLYANGITPISNIHKTINWYGKHRTGLRNDNYKRYLTFK